MLPPFAMADPRNATPPVIVVGAGLAGLTAAAFLRRRGIPVRVCEAGPQIAGLATTHVDAQGFSYDFGAHFITNRLAAAIGVSADCLPIAHYGEMVRLGGHSYSYPFGLMRSPRFLLSGLSARAAQWATDPPQSAADVFRARYGSALADEVAIPLLESWSGARATDLAPAVATVLNHSIGHTVALKINSRLRQRANAIGYCHELPETRYVWHVYPTGGVSLLCKRLAAELESCVDLETPVDRILVDAGRVVGVHANGREIPAAAVVSTAPVHILSRMVTGTDALRPLARFRYRPMVFANLRFTGRGYLPDTMLWTPDEGAPFFRLTETPLSMPWLAPSGHTLITADLGCDVGDAIWTSSDEELGERCLQHMSWIPNIRQRYLGCRVVRSAVAYPVFLNEYEQDRQALARSTGVEGLYSVGRNGEFAHWLMEDVYWRSLNAMRQLVRDRLAPAA
jgi:oxygen-dependent protoporphyrinogen oxidase